MLRGTVAIILILVLKNNDKNNTNNSDNQYQVLMAVKFRISSLYF